MKVVIFIGHFKTGSTSLQTFLTRNSAALRQQSVLYPSVLRDTRPALVRLANRIAGREQLFRINRLEAHNLLALRLKTDETGLPMPWWYPHAPPTEHLFENIRTQIEQTAPQTVLLVSEHLAELGGVDHKQIRRLGAFFAGCQIRIVATLRRPDTYLSSWHGQRLKAREYFEPLRTTGLQEYLGTVHIDYAMMLRAWMDAFPEAEFRIRNHADIMQRGGSIPSFLEDASITHTDDLQDVRPENLSVPYAFREVLRCGVRDLPPKLASNLVSWTIRNRGAIPHPPDRDVELFGAHNRQRLYSAFEPAHAFLDAFSGGGPFFTDIDDALTPNPIPEMTAARDSLSALRTLARTTPPYSPVADYLKSFEFPADHK